MTSPRRISGVIKESGPIAYAIDLPPLTNPHTESTLRDLVNHFLSFLEKESKKPCDYLRFGGLKMEKEENAIVLFAAFCPFEAREYEKKATLFLADDENIIRIRKEKRSRRNSS